MRTPLKAIISVAISSAASLLVCHVADADKALPERNGPTLTTQARPISPYSITLSLGHNWNTNYTGLPMTTVTFVNSSPHALVFALASPFAKFTVEYKASQTGLASDSAWKMLTPSFQASPDTNISGRVKTPQNHVIIGRASPLSRGSNEYDLVGFPMSAQGFYRITALTNISDVREMDGPPDSSTLVRTFTLNLRSNSVIIQRTPQGFVKVLAAASKPAPAH